MPTRGVESDGICRGDERVLMGKKVVFKDIDDEKGEFLENISCSSDESSSSIGKNSDLSENSMETLEESQEVQSSYKGPLDNMDALEEVLPIRKGISRFYTGKSKSFATLADASSSSSSTKHLAKPDNPYTRRRRNLLACSLNWDKNRVSCLRSNGGAISKRVTTSTRTTTVALAVAMNSNTNSNNKQSGKCNSSAWRSFSLADLQQCVSVSTNSDQLVVD